MFPIECPKSVVDIPSGSELLLQFFQSSGSVEQVKYSPWKSARMVLADNRDKFSYSGLADQPVIL